ncbi:hypothetical protein DH2020_010221 [Rehmannia glutinosa]|uniref:RING-type domain-containing protein n=1 Tax=Rehmannia glutinosa TaxID=99300 RepID=A0ABR0X980_REHGL
MFTSLAENSGKRKMKEVGGVPNEFNLFNLHGQHFAPPPPDRRPSQVQQILNTAAPFKPFSFMSLLTADEDDLRNKIQTEQIEQIILLHSENLRQALGSMLEKQQQTINRVAEERAAKKMKQKETQLEKKLAENGELERIAEHYKREAERLLRKVRHLEQATMSLRSSLEEATAARRYAETAQEEAESSFEDPDRVEPVRLICKACEKQLATVMVWPCRHVCLCARCDVVTKVCPVCRSLKTTSVKVYLPLD